MKIKLLSIAIIAMIAANSPQSAEASHRRFARVSPRTINSFQRDVRQFQRQSSRTFNQIDRGFNRGFRQSPVRFAPRASGVFLGSPRAGVYLRF